MLQYHPIACCNHSGTASRDVYQTRYTDFKSIECEPKPCCYYNLHGKVSVRYWSMLFKVAYCRIYSDYRRWELIARLFVRDLYYFRQYNSISGIKCFYDILYWWWWVGISVGLGAGILTVKCFLWAYNPRGYWNGSAFEWRYLLIWCLS